MASPEEVEQVLTRLRLRFEQLNSQYRSMLPARRTVEADFPDLGVAYHAHWRHGELSALHPGPADSPDIRVECDSDDLLAMASGDLAFRKAYATDRVRVEASMTDLLRLRSVL